MVLSRDLYPLSVQCPILSDGTILSPQVPFLLFHLRLIPSLSCNSLTEIHFYGVVTGYMPFLYPAQSCHMVRYYPLKSLSSSSSSPRLIPSLSRTSLTEIHCYGVVPVFISPFCAVSNPVIWYDIIPSSPSPPPPASASSPPCLAPA
jgi:hypothetical protein